MVEKIRIKMLVDDLEKPEVSAKGDWIDLRAAETVIMSKGEYHAIRLGVAMELPDGYEAIVAPRSSTCRNFNIIMASSIGVIDECYCGDNDEWKFPAIAKGSVYIKNGDRICQFRIQKHQPEIDLEFVEELGNADRGGLGSTGMR